MQNVKSLNDQYSLYSTGLLEKKDFEAFVFQTIRKELCKTGLPGRKNEDCDDYLSWLYPRISNAIGKYRETGSSFEAYIWTLLRLTAKEYISRQTRNYIAETVAWNMNSYDMFVSENEPVYECAAEEDTEKIKTAQNPRQLLILVLKCCHHVSIDFLDRISLKLGIDPDELNSLINKMKEYRIQRMKNIDLLQGKINCLFCRCMVYERNISSMINEVTIQQMKEKLERGRERLAKMRQKLSQMHPDPSNAQIARLLGISKGTVDVSLFTLKKKWNGKNN